MFGILTILSYLLERIAPETGWRAACSRCWTGSTPTSCVAWDLPTAGRSARSGSRICPL